MQSAAAERLFGYAAAELVGQPIRMLIPPERQAEEDEILAAIRRGERIDHFETVASPRTARAARRLAHGVAGPRRLWRHRRRSRRSLADITERKRAARSVAVQQEWFRVTLASIGDAVIASDASGRVTYMNASGRGADRDPVARGRPPAGRSRTCSTSSTKRRGNRWRTRRRWSCAPGQIVGLANHTVLIARDGTERSHRRQRCANSQRATVGSSAWSWCFATSPRSAAPRRRSPSSANGSRRRSRASAMR